MSKIQSLSLNVIQPNGRTNVHDTNVVSISSSSISFGEAVTNKLGVGDRDYVMFATLGTDIYVAQRPQGLPGMVLYRVGKKTKALKRLYCTSQEIQKGFRGKYELGQPLDQTLNDLNGGTVQVKFYKLVKQA